MENNKQMGEELFPLIAQIQLIVNTSLDKINKEHSVDPAQITVALKQINAHIHELSQILHQD